MVSVDVKQNQKKINRAGAHELCESRGGRPGLPVTNSPDGLRGRKATLNLNSLCTELRSCVKVEVEVDVQGSLFLIVLMVSVDVKQP